MNENKWIKDQVCDVKNSTFICRIQKRLKNELDKNIRLQYEDYKQSVGEQLMKLVKNNVDNCNKEALIDLISTFFGLST